MYKCEHNEKITTFCASECCVWKQAGGCNNCIKKYHNHVGTTLFVTEEQTQDIVKKFMTDLSAKPRCRLVQEAIFGYFANLKAQITAALDGLCKNLINQVGYPLLVQQNCLPCFKRIKNKQYKKIQQKEFRQFIELNSRTDLTNLAKQEALIYRKELESAVNLVKAIDKETKQLEIAMKEHGGYSMNHDSAMLYKLTDTVKSINSQFSDSTPKKSFISQSTKKNDTLTNELVTSSIKSQVKAGDGTKIVVSPPSVSIAEESRLAKYRPTPLSREISIDKKLKSKRFSGRQEKQDKETTEAASPRREKDERISTPKKKSQLLEMLKHQNQNLRIGRPFVDEKFLGKSDQAEQVDHLKVPSSNLANGDSSQESSYEDVKQEGKQPLQLAQAVLEYLDPVKKHPEAETVLEKKTVVVPMKEMPVRVGEMTSPMLKQKVQAKQLDLGRSIISGGQETHDLKSVTNTLNGGANTARQTTAQVAASTENRSAGNEAQLSGTPLQQGEQRSVALLVKSLGLGAEEAIPYLESSLRYADNNLSSAEYLSYLYLLVNRPRDCLNLCNKFLERLSRVGSSAPDTSTLTFNINKSAALNVLGRYSESIMTLESELRTHQKEYLLYKNLADAYFSIGIFQKAVYNYEKAIILASTSDQAHYNLAVCLFMQQNYHNAKLVVGRALQLAPKAEAYLQLAKNIDIRLESMDV